MFAFLSYYKKITVKSIKLTRLKRASDKASTPETLMSSVGRYISSLEMVLGSPYKEEAIEITPSFS